MKQCMITILFTVLFCTAAFAEEYPTVMFGSYEQDGDPENGKEPIEWLVVDENEEGSLYIAKDGLENVPYQDEKEDTSWEESDVRRWLNSTFLDTAFTAEEKERILLTTNSNEDNPDHGTEGGGDTEDYVFLLDVQETNKYFPNAEDRIIAPTKTAEKSGVMLVHDNSLWRLRTPGRTKGHAVVVLTTGEYDYCGLNVSYDLACIRPAMWVSNR